MSLMPLLDDARDPVSTFASSDALCCTWCGLPLAGARRSHLPESESIYCCFGCRMAHAITEEKGEEGAVRWTIVRLGIAIFFSMNLMAFTMTMWSLDV